jgi:hypothetical protein
VQARPLPTNAVVGAGGPVARKPPHLRPAVDAGLQFREALLASPEIESGIRHGLMPGVGEIV